ncbi:serine/threonine protein kinase [Chordicoccus furentiruminis]|uniref:serine/threonine protein kinase n=1 Tax=Chordicoccus furentiruminis TaxID=2709410 RepID=UPI0023A90F15|nr:serine/threonine-protein kinase [Chordicoccus furentiruminis]
MSTYENITLPWPEWKITEQLGRGGFGTVYKMERQLVDMKEVRALKVITIPQDADEISGQINYYGYDRESLHETYTGRMQDVVREYERMAQLGTNPNIVGCHDVKAVPHADGMGWDVFISMDLLTPLLIYMNRHPFSERDVLRLGLDLCSALTACEKINLIHRDVKPANIMVDSAGHFRLGDFGVARTLEHTTAVTQAGTKPYMAPEVMRHEQCGKTVDLYSLGLVLYWLLNNGRLPFLPAQGKLHPGDEEKALARRLAGEEFPPPANGSEGFFRIIKKACRRRPSERYADAESMRSDLERMEQSGTAGNTALGTGHPAAESRSAGSQTVGSQAAGGVYGEQTGRSQWPPAGWATSQVLGAAHSGQTEKSAGTNGTVSRPRSGETIGNGWSDITGATIGKPGSRPAGGVYGEQTDRTAPTIGRPGKKKTTGKTTQSAQGGTTGKSAQHTEKGKTKPPEKKKADDKPVYSRPKTAVVLLLMCIATFASPFISDASVSIQDVGIVSLCMIGLCCSGPVLILIGLHTLGGVLLFINVYCLVVFYSLLVLFYMFPSFFEDSGAAGVVLIGLTFLLAVFLYYVILRFIRN